MIITQNAQVKTISPSKEGKQLLTSKTGDVNTRMMQLATAYADSSTIHGIYGNYLYPLWNSYGDGKLSQTGDAIR